MLNSKPLLLLALAFWSFSPGLAAEKKAKKAPMPPDGASAVVVSVTDSATGRAIPSRLTVTDAFGKLVHAFGAASLHTAVRPGIIYTMGTPTRFSLPEGEYVIYATRGMEWSRAESRMSLRGGAPAEVKLSITREVDTTGYIAADTHVHTLTFSGHGDANVEERVITLAGEGVELAIATDHNHNTDYTPAQGRLGLNEFFTAVVGNEVSTPVGHMNGFPLDPKDAPPPYKLEDWIKVVDGIRAKGAKVVILNHPRGLKLARYGFNPFPVNRGSGEFTNVTRFPFDAMEITNPGGNFDPVYLLEDWFALLNYGNRVTAVSASDSHTVGDPVGWWRSYLPSRSDDPAKIDVDDACNRYLAGETSASLCIFTDVRVDGKYGMGQTFTPKNSKAGVRMRVAAPSWAQPRRAVVFLNGQQVAARALPDNGGHATDVWLDISIDLPKHDTYLVCAVVGDPINHPTLPGTKTKNTAFTFAVSNPVFIDGDRDGKYSSPRETARLALGRAGKMLEQRWAAIEAADEVIAVQMTSLLRLDIAHEQRSGLDSRIRAASQHRKLFREYAAYALPPEGNPAAVAAQ